MKSKFPELLVKALIAETTKKTDLTRLEKEALSILRAWDFSMDKKSSAAAIFENFNLSFIENTFKDQMGDDLYHGYLSNKQAVQMAVEQIWDTNSQWFDDITTPKTEGFARTLANHMGGILAYYDCPISTGPLEGTNNKIKTMKRQAYGFRDLEFFKLKIMGLHLTKYALVG